MCILYHNIPMSHMTLPTANTKSNYRYPELFLPLLYCSQLPTLSWERAQGSGLYSMSTLEVVQETLTTVRGGIWHSTVRVCSNPDTIEHLEYSDVKNKLRKGSDSEYIVKKFLDWCFWDGHYAENNTYFQTRAVIRESNVIYAGFGIKIHSKLCLISSCTPLM